MPQRLIRRKGDVRTAGDDRLSAASEFVGKAVGLRRESGKEGECDEIGVGVEVDRLHLLVNHTNLVARRRQGRQMNTSDRRNEVSFVPCSYAGHVNDDDLNFHGAT